MTTGTRPELPLPHFEERLSERLAELHAQRRHATTPPTGPGIPAAGPGGNPRRRSRRPLLLATATMAAAAAAVVVAVRPGPDPEPEPDRAPVSADVVVPGVLEALEPTEDVIIHSVTTWEDGTGSTESWYDEVTAAERIRYLDGEGHTLLDSGWPEPPGIDEAPAPGLDREPVTDFGQCDPGTGLSMDEEGNLVRCDAGPVPPQPFHDIRSVNHCSREYVDVSGPLVRHPGWGYLRMYLQTGDIVVDGTEQVDGRELIRLRNQSGDMVYLVDPETYLPVREERVPLEGGPPEVTTYERLPRNAENLALLSPSVPEGFTPGTVITDCRGVTVHGGRP